LSTRRKREGKEDSRRAGKDWADDNDNDDVRGALVDDTTLTVALRTSVHAQAEEKRGTTRLADKRRWTKK
jgi:hypothetical protein